jgi:hypothetical protein
MSFIVMTRPTRSSRVGWSRAYRRVGVVEIDDTYFAVLRMREMMFLGGVRTREPARLDQRCKGIVRVVETWEHLNVGLTERSAYRRALKEARTLAMLLNAGEAHDEWMAGERFARDFD